MERTTDFSDWKFRCSQLGDLMTDVKFGLTERQQQTFKAYNERYMGNGRPLTKKQLQDFFDLGNKKHSQNGQLTKGVLTHLKDVHKGAVLARSKKVRTKYVDKGIAGEETAITLYCNVTGQLFLKNKTSFENKYIKGTPDNTQKKIRELKTSWDFSTFPLYDEKPDPMYEWQVMGYQDLTKIKDGEIIHCLIDTPAKIIDDEIMRLDWQHQIMTMDYNIKESAIPLVVETISNHIYTRQALEAYCHQSENVYIDWFDDFSEVPDALKIKIFEVEYDKIKIQALYERIRKAREILNGFSVEFAETLKVTV